jgi:hypothetical protein
LPERAKRNEKGLRRKVASLTTGWMVVSIEV